MNDTLKAALEFASRGWPVLPVHSVKDSKCTCGDRSCERPAKHPFRMLAPHGVYSATTDEEKIERWFTAFPWANIGVQTGKASRIVVIDCDAPRALEKLGCRLPETARSETSRGWHLLYRLPQGVRVRTMQPGNDLSLLADGAYSIEPPSTNKDGSLRRWLIHPSEIELPPLPLAILDLFKSQPKNEKQSLDAIVRGVPEGTRNVSACALAGKLLGVLPLDDWELTAWPLLVAWNTQNRPPLSRKELRRVFTKIARRELNKRKQTMQKDEQIARALQTALKHSNLSLLKLSRLSDTSYPLLYRLLHTTTTRGSAKFQRQKRLQKRTSVREFCKTMRNATDTMTSTLRRCHG